MLTSKSIAILVAISSATVAFCQRPGDLVVTPTRIVLDDKGRSGDITLLNRSARPMRYRLTLVDMEMTQDGILKRVPTGSGHSAVNVLRLSPREIVLAPGTSQRIKIAAFFPAGQPDGELRSHLAFEPIAPPKEPMLAESDDPNAVRISFDIRSVVTIPVVARHGKTAATATIVEPEVIRADKGWDARFKIQRSGTRSVRGDVKVSFIPAKGGPVVLLGQIAALPVYFPNSDRIVTVRLSQDVAALGKGTIEITFAEPERMRGSTSTKASIAAPG